MKLTVKGEKRAANGELDDVDLNGKYRDKVTGIEGIATCKFLFANGCLRVQLEYAKDGEPKDSVFDVQRLEPVQVAPPVAEPPNPRPGGSRPTPRSSGAGW